MTLYEVLGIGPGSPDADIKAAFRKLAQEVHPDHHSGDPGAQDRFLEILRAYEVLTDPAARATYDKILAGSDIRPRKTKKKSPEPRTTAPGIQLNKLLWDLEPVVSRIDERSPEALGVLRVLTFWDRWVLEPAGFKDYFWEARQLIPVDLRAYRDFLGPLAVRGGHFPFSTVAEYFYDIRKRTGKYLQVMDRRDLSQPIPGTEISLAEAIFEVQGRTEAFLGRREWVPTKASFGWW